MSLQILRRRGAMLKDGIRALSAPSRGLYNRTGAVITTSLRLVSDAGCDVWQICVDLCVSSQVMAINNIET